jgi:serine/threonine protein kinase
MYYAVCGRAPFRGATQAERGHSICHDTVEYPAHIPAVWQDLLNRVLEKNPMRRATLAQLKKHPVFVGGSLAEYQDSEMSPNGSSMGSSWDAPSSDGSTQPSTPRDGAVASPLIVSEAQVNDSIKPVTSGGDFGSHHAGRRVTFYGQMFRKTGSAFAADTAPRAFAMPHASGISRESPEPLGLRHGMSNTFSGPDRAGAAARTAFHQQQPAVPPPGMLPPVRRTSLTSMASIAVPMPIPTLPSLSASPHRVTGMAMAMPPVAAASAAAGSATSRPSYQQPSAGTDSALPPLRPSSGGVTRRPHLASLAVR